MQNVVWAKPQEVTDVKDCLFYHTMDIPGTGHVEGQWDLRGIEANYLGSVDLKGKQVLEIGTASGHMCFSMERMGATVTAYDLSPAQDWDIVPFANFDLPEHIRNRKEVIANLNRAYWLAHKAFNSKARVTYGTVYEIPDDIGTFDVATMGALLLHLRDPFQAVRKVAGQVRETMIVTEWLSADLQHKSGPPLAQFLPNAEARGPFETWWFLAPRTVAEFLKILGFPKVEISFHKAPFLKKPTDLFTVVGRR